mmetsp:Transcript_25001/g.53909  ORF Transcript_25001/g.53909 Transcript_25001/m.53909 type:complete len:130 (+) Transcript_25001:803-1192(+)
MCEKHNFGRTARECHDRWTRYLKPGSRKGQWTEEEDAAVLRVIVGSGAGNAFTLWSHLACQLPTPGPYRNGRQIRDRWFNYLNPGINPLPLSPVPFSDDAVANRKRRREIIDGKRREEKRKVVVSAPTV